MKRSIRVAAAFSLVEVTLALGIAAVCLISVIGIIPVGVKTTRDATSQTAATNIMAAVIADLRATPTTTNSSLQFGLGFGSAGTQTRYFDGSGMPSLSLTANSRYRSDITWSVPPTGLRYVDVKVWWPAAAGTSDTASGSTEMFAAFDRN
jgi:Tfp pilus assembly protein PilV